MTPLSLFFLSFAADVFSVLLHIFDSGDFVHCFILKEEWERMFFFFFFVCIYFVHQEISSGCCDYNGRREKKGLEGN